jgi:hypothetical protein
MSVSLLKAILIAPLSQLMITAAVAVYYGTVEDSGLKETVVSWVALSMLSTAIAYISTILIGLPVHLWLKRQNLSTVRNYSIAGVFMGIVAAMMLILPHTTVSYLGIAPLVFLSSLIVATSFGVLAVSRETRNDHS